MDSKQKIEIVNKCHDIQVSLGNKTVPEYEAIPEIGMMIRLALHIRGLPLIDYQILKLVADYYLQIPPLILKTIVKSLEDIEFLKIDSEGDTIKSILPTVPYFDDVYEMVGDFAQTVKHFNEPELVAIDILKKLSDAPINKSSLYELGSEKKVVDRTLSVGKDGGFLLERKARGKEIILSPTYFMDNAELYADLVAKTGANQVRHINQLLKESQGWLLRLIESQGEIQGTKISPQEIQLLKRLAQDGAVKPPSIKTPHAGENYFMFTPTPGIARLHPGKKEIYERATNLLAAVRQGQLLPRQFAIRSPHLLLTSFRDKGYLRANTEASEQYKTLAVMRMCRLEPTGNGWHRLTLNDAPENREALDIAISLLDGDTNYSTGIDDNVRLALQQDQEYIETSRSSIKLRESGTIPLDDEQKEEIDNLLLGGMV